MWRNVLPTCRAAKSSEAAVRSDDPIEVRIFPLVAARGAWLAPLLAGTVHPFSGASLACCNGEILLATVSCRPSQLELVVEGLTWM